MTTQGPLSARGVLPQLLLLLLIFQTFVLQGINIIYSKHQPIRSRFLLSGITRSPPTPTTITPPNSTIRGVCLSVDGHPVSLSQTERSLGNWDYRSRLATNHTGGKRNAMGVAPAGMVDCALGVVRLSPIPTVILTGAFNERLASSKFSTHSILPTGRSC
ncbi:hypothetical protein EmuJ_000950400 [Echinococcus multilocularis]|uniref:Uncharacterized protein n=1 Tax=Echinococcus multilocularis TaxID=6211 RepID=A0A068YHK3_ECHMU|nr:hypothetical protein EmuJ_000950400 [Echinococcus multilocularis]